MSTTPPTFTEEQETLLDELYTNTLNGEDGPMVNLTNAALASGLAPMTILFDALVPALEEVGRLFESGEYFVPEMLIAANAMQAAMAILTPLIAGTGAKPLATFVMGTVKGDIHDIGKNLCNVMLEGAGFQVIDLGVNVPVETFVEAVRTHQPAFLGMSAFLTTTMPNFKPVVAALAEAGLRESVHIFVGGAPVTAAFAQQVGADGYAPNASALVRACKEKLGVR
jgi:corrinoid protein of di/trimethylamine methyltransferase